MKKAIATAPGEATKYVDLTAEELTARQEEEATDLAAKPMREWEQGMEQSDQTLPRWAEDMIDAYGTQGLSPETAKLHADKKALRASKPV